MWVWCLERIEPDQQETWQAMMSAPLQQVAGISRTPTQRELEDEASGFDTFYAQITSG